MGSRRLIVEYTRRTCERLCTVVRMFHFPWSAHLWVMNNSRVSRITTSHTQLGASSIECHFLSSVSIENSPVAGTINVEFLTNTHIERGRENEGVKCSCLIKFNWIALPHAYVHTHTHTQLQSLKFSSNKLKCIMALLRIDNMWLKWAVEFSKVLLRSKSLLYRVINQLFGREMSKWKSYEKYSTW